MAGLHNHDLLIAHFGHEVFIEAECDDVQGGVVGVEYAQGLELEDGIGQCVEFAIGGGECCLKVADACEGGPIIHRHGHV